MAEKLKGGASSPRVVQGMSFEQASLMNLEWEAKDIRKQLRQLTEMMEQLLVARQQQVWPQPSQRLPQYEPVWRPRHVVKVHEEEEIHHPRHHQLPVQESENEASDFQGGDETGTDFYDVFDYGERENTIENQIESEEKKTSENSKEKEQEVEKNESEQKENEREKEDESQEKERVAEKKKNEEEKDTVKLSNQFSSVNSSPIVSPLQVCEFLEGQHKINEQYAQWMEFIEPIPFVIKFEQQEDLRTNLFREEENDVTHDTSSRLQLVATFRRRLNLISASNRREFGD